MSLAIKFKAAGGYVELMKQDTGLYLMTPDTTYYLNEVEVAGLVRCLKTAANVLGAINISDSGITIHVDRESFGKSIAIRREYDGVFLDIEAPYTQVLSAIGAVMEDK